MSGSYYIACGGGNIASRLLKKIHRTGPGVISTGCFSINAIIINFYYEESNGLQALDDLLGQNPACASLASLLLLPDQPQPKQHRGLEQHGPTTHIHSTYSYNRTYRCHHKLVRNVTL